MSPITPRQFWGEDEPPGPWLGNALVALAVLAVVGAVALVMFGGGW